MYTVYWEAASGLIAEKLLRRANILKSDILSRMTLHGTDTNFWYQEAPLSMTAHVVPPESKLAPRLGVRVNQPTTFLVSKKYAVS